jgi:hypothetical protein
LFTTIKPGGAASDEVGQMQSDRSRYGLLVSALGATILVVSVFLPWYGVSLTASGAALASSFGEQFAAHFGNAALQPYVSQLHGTLAGLAGQQIGTLSAHQALSEVNVILIGLGALALLDALLPLARSGASVPEGAGRAVVPLGMLAGALIVYRMVSPPTPAGEVLALSIREGAWLALLGSLMMVLGGMWPRSMPMVAPVDGLGTDVWSSLSGWTP